MKHDGREVSLADFCLSNKLDMAVDQCELEAKHKNKDIVFAPLENNTLKDHGINTFIEKWIDKFNGRRNPFGYPIGYVYRTPLKIKDNNEDPATNYATHDMGVDERVRIIRKDKEEKPENEFELNKATN